MDRLLTTVGMTQCAGDAVRLLPPRFKFDPALDDDTAGFAICGQPRLGFGPGRAQNASNPRVIASDVPQVNGRRLPTIDVQQQSRSRPAAAGEFFTEPERLKAPRAPRLHGQRARLAGSVVSLIDNSEPNTKARELARERQPRRAGAHHKHVN